MEEASRVAKEGSYLVIVDVAPFWYSEELAPILLGKKRTTKEDVEGKAYRILVEKLKFRHKDCAACGDDCCTFEQLLTTKKERTDFRSMGRDWRNVDPDQFKGLNRKARPDRERDKKNSLRASSTRFSLGVFSISPLKPVFGFAEKL